MKFDMVEVFTRAAKITWKHKILWIFGILASCGRSGGNYNSSSGNGGGNGGNGTNPLTPEMMRQLESFFKNMESWFQQNTWIFFVIFAFFFITLIVRIFFNLVGAAGLARGVVKAEGGAENLPFGELFTESLDYFWRLLGAAVAIWLPYFIIIVGALFLGMFPLISSGGNMDMNTMSGSILLILIAVCCCAFPISISLSLYHVQVKRAIMVEEMGVLGALARGWQVLLGNFFPLLIVGLALGIAGLIVGFVIIIPVILLILPLMQSFMLGNITSWKPFMAVGVFIICYSPVIWLVTGILTTYTESVWTLAYMRMTSTPKEIEKETGPVFFEANA